MADIKKMCKSCVHFDAKVQECRRYAPRPVEMDKQKKMRWPSVPPIGFCGEFEAPQYKDGSAESRLASEIPYCLDGKWWPGGIKFWTIWGGFFPVFLVDNHSASG